MRLRVVFPLLLTPQLLGAQGLGPSPSDEPFLVLVQTNPWRSVIGSDSPALVLYSSGWALQATDSVPFLAGKVSSATLATLRAAVEAPSFSDLDSVYREGPYTDAPTIVLFVRHSDCPQVVSVYAAGTLDNPSGHVPAAFAGVMERLAKVSLVDPTPWRPARTEFLLEETGQTGDPLTWPQGWPAPVRYPGFYIAYLSPEQVRPLLSWLSSRSDRPIWLRDEQRFSPLGFHYIFPGEAQWMRAVHRAH